MESEHRRIMKFFLLMLVSVLQESANCLTYLPLNDPMTSSLRDREPIEVNGRTLYCDGTLNETAPWWAAMLLTRARIHRLVFQNPIHEFVGDDALSNIYIYIYDTPEQEHLCTHFPGPATPGEPLDLNCTKPINGISVKVLKRKDPIMELSVLSACEIEVHALGFNDTENVAYLGTAFHSSTKDDRYAHKTIDGNYDTSDSECASTMSETIPWWILELDQTYSVSKIVIQTSAMALSDVNIYVGMTLEELELCDKLKGPTSFKEIVQIECPNAIEGNFVKIVVEKDPVTPPSMLTVCDKEIFGDNRSEVNLAVDRPITYQWTKYLSLPCNFAVDGNYKTKVYIESKYPLWWIVELKSIHQIQGISMFYDGSGDIGGVAISAFVGDWRTTPYVCNSLYMDDNSRRAKFNWAKAHTRLDLINIECAEPAPEGKAVKIYLNYTIWSHLYEIEIHGRSLLVTETSFECGEVLESSVGWISSFDRDGDGLYDSNEECTWIIKAPEFFGIHFTLIYMEIEPNVLCSYDYLKVYERAEYEDLVLGQYCGNITASVISTSFNTMVVKFHTDLGINYKGFNATYTHFYGFPCGARLINELGVFNINTDMSTITAGDTINCTWVLKANEYQKIDLTIWNAKNQNVNRDIGKPLKIFDGFLTKLALLGEYNSSNLPLHIVSTLPLLFVQLTTNSGLTGASFNASYSFIYGDLSLTQSGHFSSIDRNQDGMYDTDINCTWMIKAEPYEMIKLTLTYLDIREPPSGNCDTIQIYNGVDKDEDGEPIYSYCGSVSPPTIVSSTSLTVQLLTRANNTGTGFKADFTVECGGVFRDQSGFFRSVDADGDGLYEPNQNCTWTIIAGEYQTILLDIIDIDIPNSLFFGTCIKDSIRVLQTFAFFTYYRFCGSDPPSRIQSDSNILYVYFTSNSEGSKGTGFNASFSLINGFCGGVLEPGVANARLRSVDIDKDGFYEPNQDCTWTLMGDRFTHILQLNITAIDIQPGDSCGHDFIKVTAVSASEMTLIGIYCGTTVPSSISTYADVVYIQFVSDSTIEGKGFNASYARLEEDPSDRCGGDLTAPTGHFRPLDSDGDTFFDRHLNCLWRIIAGEHTKVRLAVYDVDIKDIPYELNCSGGFLKIYETDSYYGRYCEDDDVPIIFSSSSILLVQFVSTYYPTASTGFNAEYTFIANTQKCGGTVTASEGWLGFDDKTLSEDTYTHTLDCWWTILSDHDKQIQLQLVGYEANCSDGYLEIFDGIITGDGLLASYCEYQNTSAIISTKSFIYVHLYYTGTNLRKYFNVSYISTELFRSYGTLLRDMKGSVEARLVLLDDNVFIYENNLDCLWTILGDKGNTILLTFIMIDIENDLYCKYDYLKIFDGIYENQELLGTFCGYGLPPHIRSIGHSMSIQFVTDSSMGGIGFKLVYFQVNCGDQINSTEGSLAALDDDADGMYDNIQYCIWDFDRGTKELIHINIIELSVQRQNQSCLLDRLEINANGSTTTFCKSIEKRKIIMSAFNLEIHFYADELENMNNFLITYTADYGLIQQCGTELHVVKETGWLASVDSDLDGFYDNNLNCSWLIIADNHPTLRLEVLYMDIECGFDYLRIESENYCGNSTPPVTAPHSNMIQVYFYSDASINGAGFNATYYAVTFSLVGGSNCGGLLRDSSGWFSPVLTNKDAYNNNLDCQWLIQMDRQLRVQLDILHIDIEDTEECMKDFLQIYNERYCGSRKPPTIVSITNSLFVIFFSDGSINGAGFNATYVAVEDSSQNCRKELRKSGFFEPPDNNGDDQYDYNLDCWWYLLAGELQAIQLTIYDIDIAEDNNGCQSDRLEIYIGTEANKIAIDTYCGKMSPFVVNSTADRMAVHFVSDYKTNAGGFIGQFSFEYVIHKDCGAVLSFIAGWFVPRDEDNDGMYDNYLDCLWIIPAQENQTIVMTINGIDIEYSGFCTFDYLKIYNGSMSERDLIGKYCGTNEQVVVVSELTLILEFRSDGSINGPGFNATYHPFSDENTSKASTIRLDTTKINPTFQDSTTQKVKTKEYSSTELRDYTTPKITKIQSAVTQSTTTNITTKALETPEAHTKKVSQTATTNNTTVPQDISETPIKRNSVTTKLAETPTPDNLRTEFTNGDRETTLPLRYNKTSPASALTTVRASLQKSTATNDETTGQGVAISFKIDKILFLFSCMRSLSFMR